MSESENPIEVNEKISSQEVSGDLGQPEEGDLKNHEGAFWIMQRIFWGLLKSLIPLSGIALVIWIIWGVRPLGFLEGENESLVEIKSIPSEKTETISEETPGFLSKIWEKITSKSDKNLEAPAAFKTIYDGESLVPSLEEQMRGDTSFLSPENVYILAPGKSKPSASNDFQWPNFHEKNPPKIPERESIPTEIRQMVIFSEGLSELMQSTQRGTNVIGRSVDWLREAKQFATVEVAQVILIAEPESRAEKIAEKLKKGEALFESALEIKRELETQNRFWNSELALYESESKSARENFFKAVENFESLKAESLADKFQILDLKVLEARNKIQVYGSLFKNVENFERLLRQKTIPLYAPLQ